MKYLCNLLEQIGLEGERVQMVNLSAAMGARFAEIATDMVNKIREFGPNPLGSGDRATGNQASGLRESGEGSPDSPIPASMIPVSLVPDT